ncbi:hypothetical protein OXX69_000263 [Metschnikowia pulcherrima]
MGPVTLGQRVSVRGESGVVRYIGSARFAPGEWIGVELDRPHGRNDGSVQDIRYFECQNPGNYGVFVRADVLDETSSPRRNSAAGPDVKTVVHKLQIKLKAAMEEIGRSKTTIAELQAELDKKGSAQDELEGSLEQATVELEYLRTHNTELTQSLESLREKYDILSTDYSIVNEELEIYKELERAVSSSSPQGPVSVEDFQTLLQHNKKLELALSSLRNVCEDAQESKAKTIELLNTKTSEFADLKESYEALNQRLEASESVIGQLQEELEISADSRSIIEYLTSENEQLQAKLSELTQSVNELTELHEMDNSIEENRALAEMEFKQSIKALQTELSSHKSDLEKLQSTNRALFEESNDLKRKLVEGQSPNDTRQYEELILETKKLRVAHSQASLSNGILSDSNKEISTLTGRLVPDEFKSQIELIKSLKKSHAVVSSLLSQMQNFPISSLKFEACLSLLGLASSIELLECVAEFVHLKEQQDHETLEQVVSDFESNLEKAVTRYIPTDIFTLDLSFAVRLTQITDEIADAFTTANSAHAKYTFSMFEADLSISVDVAKHISSTYTRDITALASVNKELAEFVSCGEALRAKAMSCKKQIIERPDEDLKCHIVSYPRSSFISPVLIGDLKKIESEVGLEEDELVEIFSAPSFSWQDRMRLVKDYSAELPARPEFETQSHKSVYHVLSSMTREQIQEIATTNPMMEAQIMEKTQKIDELYLQIELLEKNMSSAIAGKDGELRTAGELLFQLREECRLLKQQSEDLLQANKELSAQLDALRSADHFSDYQQVPVFENLQAMKEYTKTMALVDEISLLKRMVRSKSSMGHMNASNESWLTEPLTSRRKDMSHSPGVRMLQAAHNKRKDAARLSKAIIAGAKKHH